MLLKSSTPAYICLDAMDHARTQTITTQHYVNRGQAPVWVFYLPHFLCNQPVFSWNAYISMLLMLVQPDFPVRMQQIWWRHKVWQNDLIKFGISDGSFGVEYKQQTSLLQDLYQFTPLISNYLYVEVFAMTTEKQNYPYGLPQETHTIN